MYKGNVGAKTINQLCSMERTASDTQAEGRRRVEIYMEWFRQNRPGETVAVFPADTTPKGKVKDSGITRSRDLARLFGIPMKEVSLNEYKL